MANVTPVVDAAVHGIIKRPGAPDGVPPKVVPPAAIPGKLGTATSFRALFGVFRGGVAYHGQWRERYGDIYRVPYAANPVVAIWDADEIQKVLRNDDHAWSAAMGWDSLMFEKLDPRSGNTGTLLTLDFDEHKKARKLVQPAFTQKAIEGYLAIARRHFDATLPRWIARGRVDFKAEVRTLLAAVAGEIFTGIRDPARVAIVDRALANFWKGGMAMAKNRWLSPTFRRSRRGFQTLLDTFLALVPERRKNGGDDLFSQMCQVSDRDGLDDDAMVRVFITVMFGAFDTTSLAITSMAYLLAKHPEWQKRLRDEARSVTADPLDVAGMKGLKQLEWAWKETLRLMPVASFVPRRALRDVEVGGHTLRAGTMIAPMAEAIGRHPKWWTEPSRFDPERFSPERAEDRKHPAIFLPFGAGAHACVGMQLANMEMKLFWHKLLTSCSFALEPDYEARHTHTPLGCVSGAVSLTLTRQ